MDNEQTTNQPQSPPIRAVERPQKQKKKRVRRLNRSAFRIKLLTMLGIAAAVILGFVIFFKIQTISVVFLVEGEEYSAEEVQTVFAGSEKRYYTAQEVIDASGVEVGDNLLTLNKAAVAAHVKTALPYVSQVQVKRSFPSSVTLLVTEFEITYAVRDETNHWWLINCEGTVLEETTEQEARSRLTVEGMTVRSPQIGQRIEPVGAEGADETELAAKKTAVLQVLQALEDSSEIAKKVVTLDVSASYDIILWYGSQYEIHLGTTDELAYKFAYLKGVLQQFKEQNQTYLSGVIDVTFSEGRNARFQPFE